MQEVPLKRILLVPILAYVCLLVGPGQVATAQTVTTLYQFGGGTNGVDPGAALVQGSDGNFYGTTIGRGTNTSLSFPNSTGTVFRISPTGTLTTLYQFGRQPTDGLSPYAGLVQGSDGNFYGTTGDGGTNYNSFYRTGEGTVFRISPSGVLTTLWQFGASATDGQFPFAALVQGSNGDFYGTTQNGGANGYGTVFQISTNGTLTNLWSFGSRATDGQYPDAGLIQGRDGYFYGTTFDGGTNGGVGTVFRISSTGTLTTLYQFGRLPTDGSGPNSLMQGSDGYFYSTTTFGGTNVSASTRGDGTVFRVSSTGTFTTLYQFGGRPGDGLEPYGGLVEGSDGYFYGTTYYGGTNTSVSYPNGAGTVFRISSAGTLTTLWQFSGYPIDGRSSLGGLVQGTDGNFYGTTGYGGTNYNSEFFPAGEGTVFKLIVPLSPPANQISAIQSSGTNVIFTVPSVAGDTYQLQFSSSLTATNWSNVAGVSVTNSLGSRLTVTNIGGAFQPQGFYRFDITPSGARPPD
jgi:uncharacterized repeat protein (TIGR03803 family)